MRKLIDKILDDDILTQAAALSFYSVLAVAPVLFLLVALLTNLNFEWHEILQAQVQDLMGAPAARVTEAIIKHSASYTSRKSSLWSLLILLVSASAAFTQLQNSMNLIFESPKPKDDDSSFWFQTKDYLLKRLMGFAMVLAFILISASALITSYFLPLFYENNISPWMGILKEFGNWMLFALLFSLIFRWMPVREVPWRAAIHGGLLTSAMFILGKILIGIYLVQAGVGSAYGVAGSFVALLVWVYYSVSIFLIGAEISWQLCQEQK